MNVKIHAFLILAVVSSLCCRPRPDCSSITIPAIIEDLSMHNAARTGDMPGLKKLIDASMPVNRMDNWGWTPLFHSAMNGHYECALLLIEAGACINLKTPRGGHTALHYASGNGFEQIALLLVKNGADLNIKDSYDYSPIHNAASWNHLGIARALISRKADINSRNIRGSTPLHMAVWEEHTDMAKLLIEMGADIAITDQWNNSPADLARIKGNRAIMDLFPANKDLNSEKKLK